MGESKPQEMQGQNPVPSVATTQGKNSADQAPDAGGLAGEDSGEYEVDEQNQEQFQQGYQGQSGKHQENLLTRVVSFDQKSYYLDVRENNRGKYLKLTEAGPKRRSTILLSGYVMRALQSVLDDAIKENYTSDNVKMEELDTHWVTIFSRRVLSMQKKIYIDLMQNKRGRSLNVAEVSVSRPKTSVVMSERGWFQFKRALDEIQEKFPEFAAGSGGGSSSRPQKSFRNNNRSNNNKPKAEGDQDGEGGEGENSNTKVLDNKKLQLKSKRFFFDFLENELGRYCKVSEVRKTKRETVFIPNVCFDIFIKLFEHFIDEDYETEVDGTETVPPPENEPENHTTLTRRVMKIEGEGDATGRKYNLDLRKNNFGNFLRVTELRPNRSNCVFFPAENFKEIKEIFEGFHNMP